jgi:hypothetical protein
MKAYALGKEANRFEARTLSGKRVCICGRHKREGGCALPGEACSEQRAGVSRGHSKPEATWDEGLNVE